MLEPRCTITSMFWAGGRVSCSISRRKFPWQVKGTGAVPTARDGGSIICIHNRPNAPAIVLVTQGQSKRFVNARPLKASLLECWCLICCDDLTVHNMLRFFFQCHYLSFNPLTSSNMGFLGCCSDRGIGTNSIERHLKHW